jgi:hypothetical protein
VYMDVLRFTSENSYIFLKKMPVYFGVFDTF